MDVKKIQLMKKKDNYFMVIFQANTFDKRIKKMDEEKIRKMYRTPKDVNFCDGEDNLDTTSGEKRAHVEFDSASIIAYPTNWILIDEYDVNIRDEVRRAYVLKGSCQPKSHMFPQKKFGKQNRNFQRLDLVTMCGWSIVYQKMLDFAFGRENIKREKTNDKAWSTYSLNTLQTWRQGLTFRGHDESSDSLNRGYNHMTNGKIQKELVNSCAGEVRTGIIKDIGDRVFSLMVDESRDNSVKEQMASMYGISISRLREQAYDGASNMQGEFNGLKSLILNENPYARYVHYFARQLQLAVVAVAKTLPIVENSFSYLSIIVNIVGASCKKMHSEKANMILWSHN
ncbi:uncharacterized protein LOC126687853 [Mercurialis annua]|uniref:uncharacterized protein LOC126687853 n=1 Tax=Mercurialis annua TaxID=3986 RepID=UPI00215EC648|nr:uncharacterized protein LOC126687853 [Mercurialis annua]